MTTGVRAWVAWAVVGLAMAARPVAADDIPHVEIEDLPPLPHEALGDDTSIAVASAAAYEEDVVVGAAKREQSLGNVASAVTVISGDRLRRMGYRTVAEALRGVAGVYIVDDHMNYRIGVRGLQVLGDFNTRLLVLIDGATVNEPWGQFAGVGWDAVFSIDDIARIEVIRGPVSSVYGTNAFFGIINVVTRGATEAPRTWGRITASEFEAASASAGFAIGNVDHQLRGSVAVLGRHGELLATPELGEVDADGIRAVNSGLVAAYAGAFGQLRYFRRERELPWAPYESELGSRDTYNVDTQFMAEGGYTRDLGKRITATVRGYVNRYRFRDFLVEDSSGPTVFADIGDSFWYGGEARARIEVVAPDRLGLTVGGEVTRISTNSQSGYQGDPDQTEVPKDFDVQGLYAELDGQPMSWLAFTAGVRADRHSLLEDRISPRAALFVSDKDHYGGKLLYSEGFRNPSAYEGFFDDGVDFQANPDIGAETIRSFEGVLWGRPIPGLTARASLFRWEARGLVEQEEIDIGGGETRLQFQNVGSLVSTGVEVELSYRHAEGWLVAAGGTVTKVESDDGDPMTEDVAIGAPAATGVLALSTPLLAEAFHLSGEVHAIGPRPTASPDVETHAFAGVNVVAYAPNIKGFDVTVGVRNLIGRREEIPAPEDYAREDVDIVILPGEGREAYVRVGYRY